MRRKRDIGFFIISAPRSGSTLLNAILNTHSEIFTIPPHADKFEFSGIIRLQKKTRGFFDWESRWAQDKECWDLATHSFVTSAYSEIMYKYSINKKIIGIKTPLHSFYLDNINRIFPSTKFIFLYRDGRDTALSMTRSLPKQFPFYMYAFYKWNLYNLSILNSDVYNKFPERFISVSYEELCDSPVKTLGKISKHLGIKNEYELANFPPNIKSVGKWKQGLYWWNKIYIRRNSEVLSKLKYR